MLRVAPVAALRAAAALRTAPVAAPRCVAPRFLSSSSGASSSEPPRFSGGGAGSAAGSGRRFGAGAAGIGGGFGADRREREETAQFQEYVRRRLDEIGAKMPQPLGAQEAMEADFLEEQVIEYQMSSKRRKMRDPLRDVAESEITHTNLPLLCRFVSESGAILPRKLTGVSARKQKKLTLAIKRAQVLALMPKTWKLPQYMHASYADEYSRPERPVRPPEDADFEDPPDPRFPGQLDGRARDFDRAPLKF